MPIGKNQLYALLLLCAIGACTDSPRNLLGITAVDTTTSGFRTPGADGLIDSELITTPFFRDTNTKVEDADGAGFAYSIGIVPGQGFGAYAGILPTTTVLNPPTSGTLNYAVEYTINGVFEIMGTSDDFVGIGLLGPIKGDINLAADFDSNSLTGGDDRLSVDGVLSDANAGLGGTVTLDGVTGSLTGFVGSDKAVGAFHGSDDETVFAGGFVGDAVAP